LLQVNIFYGLTEELLVDEVAQHYWRMKRFRALEAQMYRSKGPHEDGGSALDTANLVRCIDLGLFTRQTAQRHAVAVSPARAAATQGTNESHFN
jgi:hypothetical protein